MALVKISEILDGNCKDQKVTVRGWVYRKREGKSLIFLVIRDSTGVIQCTIKKDSPCWSEAQKLTIESSLILEGTAKEDTRAPGGFEIGAETVAIIGLAETFPISKDKSEEFIRDMRHLWLRSRKMNLVMKVRAETLRSSTRILQEDKTTPKFHRQCSSPQQSKAAQHSFGLKYFDQDLYLTQSSQLYLEILIYSLENVYCIAPSFRAEKSRTIRHLTEYWHIEGEWPFANMDDLMKFEEGLMDVRLPNRR